MSDNAKSEVTEHDDGQFVRTAIIVPKQGQSFDLVDVTGKRIAEVNAFVYYDGEGTLNHIIVDVIDKDNLFTERQALTFTKLGRTFTPASGVVSTDFRR